MTTLKNDRILSIDFLRGIVMIIMALDHCRFFLHVETLGGDPTNLETTTPILFLTRFITHYCAPTFVFLAGTSAFLYGSPRTKSELSRFLWTRGLWLIFAELVIIGFAWTFNPSFEILNFGVIWAIGVSMIVLAGLIWLPMSWLVTIGGAMVLGHNLLDGYTPEGEGVLTVIWYFFHEQQFVPAGYFLLLIIYPLVPWIGVMALGYAFGHFYKNGFDPDQRKKWLMAIGLIAVGAFFMLRAFNIYGDPVPWEPQRNGVFTLLSFINVHKYPPSLLFLLVTLGPGLIFLALAEKMRGVWVDRIVVFGRVPFFFYILHLYLIHAIALAALWISTGDPGNMILTPEVFMNDPLADFGYPLWVVYLVWLVVILVLYPVCYRYMRYKLGNRDKWWLSYL